MHAGTDTAWKIPMSELPRFLRLIIPLVVLVVVFTIAGVVVMFSGWIDVSALKPHFVLTKWVLETTIEHSVERRARWIQKPPGYPPIIRPHTFQHFSQMCGTCHGGLGKKPSEIGKGLRPRPPDLVKAAQGMPVEEIFWIVRNGIRMTGMPAFAVTHSDEELWEVVALVHALPDLKPAEYRNLVENHTGNMKTNPPSGAGSSH